VPCGEHAACAESTLQTGSGKTLAYLLPVVEKLTLSGRKRPGKPVALVLEPTRELALQVYEVFEKIGSRLRAAVIYGGASYTVQEQQLRQCDVVIATPGRLNDLLDRGWVDVSEVDMLIIDEADRMLDMGFQDAVTRIMATLPQERQTTLFSATMPKWCKQLAQSYMKPDTVTVDLVSDQDEGAPLVPTTVKHLAVRAAGQDAATHAAVVNEVIKMAGGGRSLVFVSRKDEVDRLVAAMPRQAGGLHGGMSQVQRERVVRQDFFLHFLWLPHNSLGAMQMNAYRKGHYNVLIATDVASRGLDIDGIKVC
jgi:ATP-dependent RNA helicase DDX21